MADNFDIKKFLVENKLGAYSRLKENDSSDIESRIKQVFEKAGYKVTRVDYVSSSFVSKHPTVEVWFENDIEEDLWDVLDNYDNWRGEDDLMLTDVDQPYNRKNILRFFTH